MAQIDLKSPAVQKAILYMIAGGALVAVFFFTRLVPFNFPNQNDKIEALKSEYEKKATELTRARATVADLPRFEAEYAHLHERWTAAAELLPTERQLPMLMRKITLAAQQNGVGFTAFRPRGIKPQDHYTESPMQLSLYGNYHQIGAFLADLANMQRIVTVANIQLKANGKQGTTGTTLAELSTSAYYLSTTPTAAPAAPAPADKKKEGDEHVHKES